MAHFAKIENGIVTQVIAVSNDAIDGGNYPDSEPIGQTFIADIGLEGLYLQTSYNNNIRHRYAGVGYSYDPVKDIFIPPQPFASWTLNDQGDWVAPKPEPQDGKRYLWDEPTQTWVEQP